MTRRTRGGAAGHDRDRHELPSLTLSRPRWRRAAWAAMLTAALVNVFGGLAEVFIGLVWLHGAFYMLVWVLFGAAIFCMSQAVLFITPRRGTVTYHDGTRVRVTFTPDPDGPPGTYVAKTRNGSPVPSTGAVAVAVNSGQVHQSLRIGDLTVPLWILVAQGQKFERPAPPS